MDKALTTTKLEEIKNLESSFKKVILSKFGIDLQQHQLPDLHKGILEACHKFNCTPHDYFDVIKNLHDQSPEIDHLISAITVGETYFFRDDHQMKLLRQTVLPSIIEKKRLETNRMIRIWSAGCSSGEELYSIAMILSEDLKDLDNWSIKLLGTDINTKALSKAIQGEYTEWSMRSIEKGLKNKYFTENNKIYTLDSRIKDMATFDYLNLQSEFQPSIFNFTNSQDLILCRNVLIYFDRDHIAQVMKKFSSGLLKGGYLLLGASDPIVIENTELVVDHDNCTLFAKTDKTNHVRQPRRVYVEANIANQVEQIQVTSPKRVVMKQTETRSTPIIDVTVIEKLSQESRWQDIIDFVELNFLNGNVPKTIVNVYAIALANVGRLEESYKYFEISIQSDPTNKITYYAFSMVLSELNMEAKAEEALKKTLYLDHSFAVGHYQLGLLLLRNKKTAKGIKHVKNAYDISKLMPAEGTVDGADNLTYGRLAEILSYEIEMHSTKKDESYACKEKRS